MNYTECIENARPRLGKYCKACPECNGRACKNQMPGPGSKGIGDTAIRNYDKWKQICVNMDTIAENKPVDTSLSLFGRTFKYPVFAGPVGAVQLHYGETVWMMLHTTISSCQPVQRTVSQLSQATELTQMSWLQPPRLSKMQMVQEYLP